MINTIIDDEILKIWFKNWPKSIPEGGSIDENSLYQNFFEFLHKNTNLEVVNHDKDNLSIIYTMLTRDRGENAKYSMIHNKFETPYKFMFDIDKYYKHILLINEDNEENKKKYLRRNQIPIGFKDTYLDVFKRIDLFDKSETLPVRVCENGFRSWSQLKDYLIDFSDVILIDSFILNNEETYDANLYEIIRRISKKAKEKEGSINLLIVSYLGEDEVKRNEGERIYKKIQSELISKESQNINLGLVFLGEKGIKKEHDRTILFNFLRIKSGDSFVYFSCKGDYLTEGTDIDFQKQTRQDYCNSYNALIQSISKKINSLKKKNSIRLIGNIENRIVSKI